MQFKTLHISMPERWEPEFKTGMPRGLIEMEGSHSKVAVKLNGEQCRAILAIVGQAAKDTTEEAVRAMTAEVFSLPASPLIEG